MPIISYFIITFIFYILGIFSFYYLNSFYISTFLVCIISFITLYSFYNQRIKKFISIYFIFLLFFSFLFGYINAKSKYTFYDDFSSVSYLKNIEIKGRVLEVPKYQSSKNSYKFPMLIHYTKIKNIEYKNIKAKIQATITNDNNGASKIKYGDTITIKGNLTTPNKALNPSQFDYQKFLQNRGILKTFYAKDDDLFNIEPLKLNKGASPETYFIYFMQKMNELRDRAIEKHNKYIKTPRLEILGGIVFGDDAVNPPDDIKESFINSGLLHLLAASGLNVGLILSLWLFIIYFINIPYKLKILSGIIIIFLYTIMTGFPPSVIRASVMLTLMLFGKMLFKKADNFALIFMAGFIILLFRPDYAANVSFQLSFLVTFGLILCINPINKLLTAQNKRYIKSIKNYPDMIKSFLLMFSPISLSCCFMIPLVAQIWASPLQAYYFNTFSTYSFLANISVIPFIGIVSFLGFITTAFCFIPKISDVILLPFDFILNHVIQIILNISDFFSKLTFSVIKIPSPSVFQIIVFYIFIIFLFKSVENKFKVKYLNILTTTFVLVLFLSLFFSLFFIDFIKSKNNISEVIFFSVGNADNCLIKTPKNKYIMIDTGRYIYKNSSSAKMITLEYLYDKNIKEIDTLIVTHYDSDHSGGLIDILDKVKVNNLIIPKPECKSVNSCLIKKYIEENNIKYIEPYTGQYFKYETNNNNEYINLFNIVPKTNDVESRNAKSTITLIDINNIKLLFMADSGIKSYHSIEKHIPFDIDILKASHHGAKNTVDDIMLKKLRPKYSIISTGKNPYGHPDLKTIHLLKQYGKVLSTKDMGAITFTIGNMKINAKGFLSD